MTQEAIPVTVIVPVKNEQKNLGRCLERLKGFSEIFVVDSASTDRTCEIARSYGAQVVNFSWNGKFPKKRNWCLRHLKFSHDWILFLDADELVTEAFEAELR